MAHLGRSPLAGLCGRRVRPAANDDSRCGMDLPARICRGRLRRRQQNGSKGRFCNRSGTVWKAPFPDPVQRRGSKVGAIRCLGFSGQWSDHAANAIWAATDSRATLIHVKTTNVTLSLPDPLLRRFRVYAATKNRSMSSLMTDAIEKIIDSADEAESAQRRLIERMRNAPDLGSRGKYPQAMRRSP